MRQQRSTPCPVSTIHSPPSTLHSITRALGAIAIVSGILVLLGWFTLPVRVALLVAVSVAVVYSFLSFRAKRGISHERTAVPMGEIPRRNLGMTSGTVAIIAAALAAILLLWHSGTTEPLRSPWTVVPAPFFVLYALMAVFGIQYSVFSIAMALGLASSVALLVYPIGFGFDHFIHAAAERIIATAGALSPPPLFYSGHYGLTVLLADLLPGVTMDLADRLLAPLLALLLVPLAYRSLRTMLSDRAARLGLSSLLIVPFLPLAVSTPQATANVFALATVLLLMERSQSLSILSPPPSEGEREGVYTQTRDWSARGWVTPFATAIAALLAQPMTGIITIAIVMMAYACQRGWRMVATTIAVLGAAGIPLAFAIAGRIIPNLDLRVSFHLLPALQHLVAALHDAITLTAVDFSTADALALARILLPTLWVVLSLVGASSTYVTHTVDSRETSASVLHSAFCVVRFAPLIALTAAALVAATITVPTQLAEEQTQFPLRLLQLAALLAMPLAAVGIGTIADRLRGTSTRIAGAITIGVAATFTLLLAYPRDDAQARSGLWSVSASDIAAVHAIANDVGDAPYVVLANQMLGAAAIRELGFRPAYRLPNGNEILAFPLPAGGPIARAYWEFVSQDPSKCFSPSREEGERPVPARASGEGEGPCTSNAPITAAMNLVGANRAYVVIHDYWRNSQRLGAVTATIANQELPPLPHLRIFRFERSRLDRGHR